MLLYLAKSKQKLEFLNRTQTSLTFVFFYTVTADE